jgi:hypothetical protein
MVPASAFPAFPFAPFLCYLPDNAVKADRSELLFLKPLIVDATRFFGAFVCKTEAKARPKQGPR